MMINYIFSLVMNQIFFFKSDTNSKKYHQKKSLKNTLILKNIYWVVNFEMIEVIL